ncbi:hypothetical protein EV714DRAFT_236343 [Schizophyllum commune]
MLDAPRAPAQHPGADSSRATPPAGPASPLYAPRPARAAHASSREMRVFHHDRSRWTHIVNNGVKPSRPRSRVQGVGNPPSSVAPFVPPLSVAITVDSQGSRNGADSALWGARSMGVAYARARPKRGCGGAWGAHARGAAEHPALRERHRRKRLGLRPFDGNSTLGWLNKFESSNAPKFVFSAGARAHAPLFPVANIFAGHWASLYALPRPSLVLEIRRANTSQQQQSLGLRPKMQRRGCARPPRPPQRVLGRTSSSPAFYRPSFIPRAGNVGRCGGRRTGSGLRWS